MKEVIIIGSGSAGIVSGIYAARKNLDSLLLTKDFVGQLANAGQIENWPGEESIQGPELLDNFLEHLKSYDVDLRQEEVEKLQKEGDKFLVKTEKQDYQSKSVIVASGRKPRKLNVAGEKEFVGQGVSYCVTCDGALFRDKSVVVVGGGNAGLEGALELSEYAKEVKIFEMNKDLQGDEFLIRRLDDRDNITVKTEVTITEILGDDFVTGARVQDVNSKKVQKIETDGIFIEIGSVPITNFIDEDLVEFNEGGEIKIDPRTCSTKTEGLFAAGDVTDVSAKQVVVAAGAGTKALLAAYDYIKEI